MNNSIEIFTLVKNHSWDKFKELYEKNKNIDINIKDNNSIYLIVYIIMYNKLDILKLIINSNVRLDIFDTEGNSILYIPIKFGYDEILDILLQQSSKTIGIPMSQIKDKNGRIALHYAIYFKNTYAIKKLLPISNVNTQNNNGYNALHMATYAKDSSIFDMILPLINNINATCNTGETCLHIACNLQVHNLIESILQHHGNPDIQEHEHEYTALHYSCSLGDTTAINILLKYGANINTQDFIGNTPFHYTIINDNIELTKILLTNKYSPINVNLYNINLCLPLHIVLMNNFRNMYDYIEFLLNDTNINFQNNEKSTCLHYLCQNNYWKRYKNILEKKKLDIFIKNDQNQRSIDFIEETDINEFLDMVTSSYIYMLKNKKHIFEDEWENICSHSPDDKEILQLQKLLKITNKTSSDENLCQEIIKQKLVKLSKEKSLTCNQKSYPLKKSYQGCIKFDIGSKVSFCTFTGSPIDIVLGLLFLLTNHPDACTPMEIFKEENEICHFFDKLNIVTDQNCKLMNYMIVWAFQTIYFSEKLDKLMKYCRTKESNRYTIIPLGIVLQNGTHSNYLLYDKQTNEIERFEPYGYSYPTGLNYEPQRLDIILENKFKRIIDGVTYIRPLDYLPKIGLQSIDTIEDKNRYIGDPNGFCALWSIWYIDMRITHNYVKRDKLIKYMLKNLYEQHISFKTLIRNYAKKITDLRDQILSQSHININEWLNDQYDEKIFNEVINSINKLFTILSSTLN